MNPELFVRLDQKRETAPQTGKNPFLSYRYAYARSADSRHDDEPGQDYLAFADGEDHFVFAACDGVSQSFYGDLAAQLLGDALVDWLATNVPAGDLAGDDPAVLTDTLTAFLLALTTAAAERVDQYPIPDGPPLLRDVLLEKQARGSEAMFVCGRIDPVGPALPDGRVLLAWMGDMRVYLWHGDRQVDLGGAHETRQRWSSRRGPVGGAVNLYHGPLSAAGTGPARLVVYSDGLKSLDERVSPTPTDEMLRAIIQEANAQADSDDVTYLELMAAPAQKAAQPFPIAPVAARPAAAGRAAPVVPIPPNQYAPPPPANVTAPVAATARRGPRWPLVAGGIGLVALCVFLWLVLDPANLGGLSPLLVGLPGFTAATPTPTAETGPTAPRPTAPPPAMVTVPPSSTATVTPTTTATPTASPTATVSPSPTSTPTASPTATVSLSPTSTPTASPTATVSPSPIPNAPELPGGNNG